MVWKAFFTPRSGSTKVPRFPTLKEKELALTWIGHASFLLQFTDLNVIIDPNFANWLFLLKRIKRSGLKLEHLPPIDLVLLTMPTSIISTNPPCAGCLAQKSASCPGAWVIWPATSGSSA